VIWAVNPRGIFGKSLGIGCLAVVVKLRETMEAAVLIGCDSLF